MSVLTALNYEIRSFRCKFSNYKSGKVDGFGSGFDGFEHDFRNCRDFKTFAEISVKITLFYFERDCACLRNAAGVMPVSSLNWV